MSVPPSSDDPSATAAPADALHATPARAAAAVSLPRPVFYGLAVLVLAALAVSAALWQRLSGIQEQLARQSADSGAAAIEARALARQAQDMARDIAARQAVTDNKLGEVALQRTQLEELMQSLSRSRDENLIVDIESALRLAQQQSQLTLSPEPLLAALRAADQRLARASQPRLARVRAAVARDIDRIKTAGVTDVPALLIRMDELARSIDELPVANAVGASGAAAAPAPQPVAAATPASFAWWERSLSAVLEEARGLVRVSRIDRPEAALVAPEQAFFLRENIKLKLLNARLSLLARQSDLARADMASAAAATARYFDPASRKTQVALGLLQQMQGQMRSVDLPRIDETLALLDTTAAGR
jgi:uroporphyrin-3 C-methyltransferase